MALPAHTIPSGDVVATFHIEARRSGLIAALGATRWHTLSTLASYMDTHGWCYPSEEELAHAMGITRSTASRRVTELETFRFNGQPVITVIRSRKPDGSYYPNRYRVLPASCFSINHQPRAENRTKPMSQKPHKEVNVVVDQKNTGSELEQLLVNTYNISPEAASSLCKQFSEDYIRQKISMLESYQGDVRHQPGWLRAAIEEDWQFFPRARQPRRRSGKKPRSGHQTPSWAQINEENALENFPSEPAPDPYTGPPEARAHWQTAYDQMALSLPKDTFNNWLRSAKLRAFEDNTYTVQVRDLNAQSWLNARLKPVVNRTLNRIAGQPVEVRFVAG